jgi:hypothetical protein
MQQENGQNIFTVFFEEIQWMRLDQGKLLRISTEEGNLICTLRAGFSYAISV